MWCLQTLEALNQSASKTDERTCFAEVGIAPLRGVLPDDQAIIPWDETERESVMRMAASYPFCNE